jgi:hypothetical protein
MGADDKWARFRKFCDGVRAIAPGVEIHIRPSEAVKEHWSILVHVGAAIILYTDYGSLDDAVAQASGKLAGISSRMMAAIREAPPLVPSTIPPPPESPKK